MIRRVQIIHTDVRLSDDVKSAIRSHFPKADAVIEIRNPEQFVREVTSSIGCSTKDELVHYFNIENGRPIEGQTLPAMDMEYMKYLVQDSIPHKEGNTTMWSFTVDHVYRVLFCKDLFFSPEQEYRILLPDNKIDKGTSFDADFSEDLKMYDLEEYFDQH